MLFWLKTFNFESMLLKMVIGMKGFEFLSFARSYPVCGRTVGRFGRTDRHQVAQMVIYSVCGRAPGRAAAQSVIFASFALFVRFW